VLIMLAIDVVLGPLFTAIVYDRRKPRLAMDLAVIVALQAAALAYGLHAIERGRPAFVVLVKDRFEVVSPADLDSASRAQARANPLATIDPLRPRWVAARLPESAEEQALILAEAIAVGRDVQHHPKHYVEYGAEAAAALERALSIARLKALNPARIAQIEQAVAATGLDEARLRYLPIRGPARDGAVLIDAASGRIERVLQLTPW